MKIIPPVTVIQYLRCLRENGRARSFDTAFVYHTRPGVGPPTAERDGAMALGRLVITARPTGRRRYAAW